MVDAKLNSEVLARLARCTAYWERQGYQFVPLPWVADERYTAATKPSFVKEPDIATPHGNLVASGEQAFLRLMEQGQLPEGTSFVGWTPCFRNEATFDSTHHLYFMKAELFVRCQNRAEAAELVREVALTAQSWMHGELLAVGVVENPLLVPIGDLQLDLELGGIELGSYGYRELFGQGFVYGTGCAEPRFSQAAAVFDQTRGGATSEG